MYKIIYCTYFGVDCIVDECNIAHSFLLYLLYNNTYVYSNIIEEMRTKLNKVLTVNKIQLLLLMYYYYHFVLLRFSFPAVEANTVLIS